MVLLWFLIWMNLRWMHTYPSYSTSVWDSAVHSAVILYDFVYAVRSLPVSLSNTIQMLNCSVMHAYSVLHSRFISVKAGPCSCAGFHCTTDLITLFDDSISFEVLSETWKCLSEVGVAVWQTNGSILDEISKKALESRETINLAHFRVPHRTRKWQLSNSEIKVLVFLLLQ